MADQTKYLQTQKHTLKTSISLSATSIELNSFNLPDGTAIVSGDLGAINYATLAPGTANEEQITFTGLSGTTLTGVTRGISFDAPYSADSSLRKAHSAGTVLVLSNTAAFYDSFVNKNNDETITGTLNVPTPTSGSHATTKDYVDGLTLATGLSYDSLVVAGTAGATVAAGDIVYFDATDKEWKLADASAAATSENVILGIAQGAGTDGNSISGGVLLRGLDTNQTGMTAGTKQYLSDTAGGIAESAGTVEVTLGTANTGSTTDLLFDPNYDQKITEDIQDALAGGGDLGTPSGTNKYLTESLHGAPIDEQVFSSTNTWTKPSYGRMVKVEIWGAGGGGGGGRDAATTQSGGAGGGGGAYNMQIFPIDDLGATETVTIGAGGAGGAVEVDGSAGGNTTFGSHLTAYGGGGGSNGESAADNSGGSGGGIITAGGLGTSAGDIKGGLPALDTTVTFDNVGRGGGSSDQGGNGGSADWGGGAGGGGAAGSAFAGGSSIKGGAGGGGGGDHNTAGGAGGDTNEFSAGGGAAGGAVETAGSNGSAFQGGGGGGGANTGTAGAGGNGGTAAGGGGGGSCDTDIGTAAGAGGNGGDGYAVITTF